MAARDMKMALTEFGARRLSDPSSRKAESVGARSAEVESLEAEIRLMRDEFARLRELIAEREEKGRTLVNAYREVIAELTDLFESERKENIKREESLRFFLSSIEGRIREDIRNELRGGATAPADAPVRRRKRWFGRV